MIAVGREGKESESSIFRPDNLCSRRRSGKEQDGHDWSEESVGEKMVILEVVELMLMLVVAVTEMWWKPRVLRCCDVGSGGNGGGSGGTNEDHDELEESSH
ncbi:hypothetical protein Tco_0736747 [Tanacetum coccineum]